MADDPTKGETLNEQLPSNMTIGSFLYLLVTRHLRRVFGLLLFIFICTWLFVSYVRPQVEISGAGAVTIRPTFGPEQHLQFVSPFGWQSTGVHLKRGDEFDTTAVGKVSVGFAEFFWDYLSGRDTGNCIEVKGTQALLVPDCFPTQFKKPPLEPKWPWVGPNGYPPDMYNEPRYAATPYWNAPNTPPNKGMLVNGIPHGTLIGYISPEGRLPLPEEVVPRDDVMVLGANSVQHALRSGILCVTVNDAVGYFDDNLGYFVLTITKH